MPSHPSDPDPRVFNLTFLSSSPPARAGRELIKVLCWPRSLVERYLGMTIVGIGIPGFGSEVGRERDLPGFR